MKKVYKCKECRSEFWEWLLLDGRCRDCGGETKPLKGEEKDENGLW